MVGIRFAAPMFCVSGIALAVFVFDAAHDLSGSAATVAASFGAPADVQPTAGSSPVAASVRGTDETPTQAYAAILSRPVFSRTRRPPEARPAVAPPITAPIVATPAVQREPPVKTGQFNLVGVVIIDGKKRALVRQGRDQDLLRLSEGDEVDGWSVESIEADTIRFASRGVVDVVPLYTEEATAKPASGRTARTARTAPAKKPALHSSGKGAQQQASRKPHLPQTATPARHPVDHRNFRVAQDTVRREALRIPVRVKIVGVPREEAN